MCEVPELWNNEHKQEWLFFFNPEIQLQITMTLTPWVQSDVSPNKIDIRLRDMRGHCIVFQI